MTRDNISDVQGFLREVIGVMRTFPKGYVPGEGPLVDFDTFAFSKSATAQAKLQELIDSWPKAFFSSFLSTTATLGQVLSGYGPAVRSPVTMLHLTEAGLRDPKIWSLMMQAALLSKEIEKIEVKNKESYDEKPSFLNPTEMPLEFINEAKRRVKLELTPYGTTISTLLGHNALQWLAADSRDGSAKIQPHEFSRTGWNDLSSIQTQIAIEKELMRFGKDNGEIAKIIVALCWTAAALASFIEPSVFLSEMDSHVSSNREGQLTISRGRSTHALVSFDSQSMVTVVEVLHDALGKSELAAADLMWIADGLAKIRTIQSGHSEPARPSAEIFSVFLSHRGQDAKKILADKVMALSKPHGIFLDCLNLPRGLINRKFVFGSLTCSEHILLIETSNYEKSEWCRKERWLAEVMQRLKLAKVKRVSIEGAEKFIEECSEWKISRRTEKDFDYPITERVLRDIDYWARHPNKHSLEEKNLPIDFLKGIEEYLKGRPCSATSQLSGAAEAVKNLFSSLGATNPLAEPVDSWSTALQYAVATLGARSFAQSKMDVRRGIDQMNTVLNRIVSSGITQDHIFRENITGYLAFLSAAVVLDLSGFTAGPDTESEISAAVGDVAILRNGILLLDVRHQGPRRDVHLKLLLILATNNIGSVGIIQSACDAVHELEIEDQSLSVLPCVTLHPGMEVMFPELKPLSHDILSFSISKTVHGAGVRKRWWQRLTG